MLGTILNIVGIILILYSIYIIRKDSSVEDYHDEYLNLNKIEELDHKTTNQENFENIIKHKVNTVDLNSKKNENPIEENTFYKKTTGLIKDERDITYNNNLNPLHEKIIKLSSIGLSNEEIARKCGKSIREIDIIIKISENDNKII